MFIYHNINGVKYTSVMMHLLDYNGLEEGDVVSEGEVVAHMGGYSTARKMVDTIHVQQAHTYTWQLAVDTLQ